jgi:hypothetical protein
VRSSLAQRSESAHLTLIDPCAARILLVDEELAAAPLPELDGTTVVLAGAFALPAALPAVR